MICEEAFGSLHCQYQALRLEMIRMNTFSSAALCAAFLAPACGIFGAVAQRLRLPQITGFLVSGIIAGPHLLNLLTHTSVQRLWMVDQACLSVIALAAGAELQWEQLDKVKKQVIMITLGISGFTWGIVYATMLALSPLVSTMSSMTGYQVAAVCSLAATLMVARSPASAIAVLQEVGGKGPFCSLVMAVVIVKDVVTIVAFAMNIEIARTLFASADEQLTVTAMFEPFVSLVISLALGVIGSLVLSSLYRMLLTRLSGPLTQWLRPVLTMVLSMLVFEAASCFEAEPLLACALAGLLTTNTLKDTDREAFHGVLGAVMPHVNLAFFSLAGASLQLDTLAETMWLGSTIAGVRVVAVYVGSHAGCTLSECSPEHRKRMWRSMITQAGVALGLARMVAVRFPTWGPFFQTLMASIIVLNLLLGPPLFRHAIISIGESKTYGSHKVDDQSSTPDSTIAARDAPLKR